MEKEYELLIKKAVDFFVNLLQNPTYGDKQSGMEGLASMISTFVKLKTKKEITEKQIELFRSSLEELIKKQTSSRYRDVHLDIGWFPEGILAEACAKAEIWEPGFPSKFSVIIDFKNTTVTKGYFGQNYEKL